MCGRYCGGLDCALSRALCGHISYDMFRSAVAKLPGIRQAPLKWRPVRSRGRPSCLGMGWSDARSLVLACGRMSSADDPVVVALAGIPGQVGALVAVIKSVETDDKGLFAEVVARHLPGFQTCKGLCMFLARVCAMHFHGYAAAQWFMQLAREIRYCHHHFTEDISYPMTPQAIKSLFASPRGSRGFRTLLEHGPKLSAKKNAIERALLAHNRSKVHELATLPPTFIALRRYSSFAPAVNFGLNFGGGYFLWTGQHGVVLDPGFDFVKNFLIAGLPLTSISTVVITHAHPDHLADFIPLTAVLHEMRESYEPTACRGRGAARSGAGQGPRDAPRTAIDVYLSNSAYEYLHGIIGLRDSSGLSVHIMESGRGYDIGPDTVMVATPTRHSDCIGDRHGAGVMFVHKKRGAALFCTSDTAVSEGLITSALFVMKQWRVRRLTLCANIGGTHDSELMAMLYARDWLARPDFVVPPSGYRYPTHLGILGVASLVSALRPAEVIVTEIGVEMNGYRAEVGQSLSDELDTPCVVADMGFSIRPFEGKCYAIGPRSISVLCKVADVRAVERAGNLLYLAGSDSEQAAADLSDIEGDLAWRRNLPPNLQ